LQRLQRGDPPPPYIAGRMSKIQRCLEEQLELLGISLRSNSSDVIEMRHGHITSQLVSASAYTCLRVTPPPFSAGHSALCTGPLYPVEGNLNPTAPHRRAAARHIGALPHTSPPRRAASSRAWAARSLFEVSFSCGAAVDLAPGCGGGTGEVWLFGTLVAQQLSGYAESTTATLPAGQATFPVAV
jgi:hypothetical protein